MIKAIYRMLFLLFVIAGGLRSSAQTVLPSQSGARSEVALWSVGTFIADTTLTDTEGDSLDILFEEKPGFGVSFNHYWTDQFSTEVSLMAFSADMNVSSPFAPEFKLGTLNAHTETAMAQWHFRPGARVMPYLSGGIAHIGGTFDPNDPEDPAEIDLESNVTWTAAVGLDIRLTDRWALAFEAKRVPWNAVEEGGSADEAIDIDPMLYGSGVRFRF
ncbi:MAG TPA: OmpW family outer membrane protein [Thermoanaerobaculia bacterium]|nr:OmpW family outer membrane protein [Thermoanaerobaculia bacterium]